jgi:hypothetical protein
LVVDFMRNIGGLTPINIYLVTATQSLKIWRKPTQEYP